MKFDILFKIVINKWPNVIDVSDGVLIDNDGFYSNNLSNAWTKLEETVGQEDEWRELMTWSMYNVIHYHSSVLFKDGFFFIKPNEIDINQYKKRFIEDLKKDGYEDMLSEFKSNNIDAFNSLPI